MPALNKSYDKDLGSVTAPTANSTNAELKKALEDWYGMANSLGGSNFLRHHLMNKEGLQPVPFQQGIITISNCPNPSSPIFADQECVKKEWGERNERLDKQRGNLITKIEDQLEAKKSDGTADTTTRDDAKKLIAWYAVDDTPKSARNFAASESSVNFR